MNTLSTLASRSRLITATIFGALALSFGAMSIAADNSDIPRTVVKYGDLNLSNPQGAATLYRRIDVAAHEVCDESYEAEDLDLWTEELVTACIHRAISNAVAKVGAQQLYVVYNAKNHRSR